MLTVKRLFFQFLIGKFFYLVIIESKTTLFSLIVENPR